MIDRFVDAQHGNYKTALEEIKNGKKKTHWMWFIFPQIKGLGDSDISKYFAIQSMGEAEEYLAHPILGSRLFEISEYLLYLETNDPVEIFGGVDALKLQASMTLFWEISRKDVFRDILLKYFGGYLDYQTMQILRSMEQ